MQINVTGPQRKVVPVVLPEGWAARFIRAADPSVGTIAIGPDELKTGEMYIAVITLGKPEGALKFGYATNQFRGKFVQIFKFDGTKLAREQFALMNTKIEVVVRVGEIHIHVV